MRPVVSASAAAGLEPEPHGRGRAAARQLAAAALQLHDGRLQDDVVERAQRQQASRQLLMRFNLGRKAGDCAKPLDVEEQAAAGI